MQINPQNLPMPESGEEAQRRRLGRWHRRRREELGKTQREIAEQLGVDHKLVSRVESGQGGSEELLVAMRGLYKGKIDYADAPIDPVRRRAYFDARNAMLQKRGSMDAALTKSRR